MPDHLLPETLVSLFSGRVASDGDRTALWIRPGEEFRPVSWNQLAADVRRTAAALRRLGLQPGDRVVQVSENRYEWIVLDLAVHLARGVHVAVHSTLSGVQIAYQIRDSGARIAIVSGPAQAEKLTSIEGELSPEVHYFALDACDARVAGQPIRQLDEVVRQSSEEAGRSLEQEALRDVGPNNLATILYTSGTTGEPKGVMLSHGNLASNAVATLQTFPCSPDDLRLCWLPLSHIFARTADLYTWIARGCELALAQSRETILADCARLRPTLLNGVPYFYDKVSRYLRDQGRADEPGSLQQLLGGRMRVCCSGGAPLADHVAEFFQQRGVLLLQGYGLTESSPVITSGSPTINRIGTVGRPIPGVEVKIAEDGEVLTRGPHVMLGYWKKPQATAEVIREGWLHTGDLGRLEDGYLRITGRKKELIVTAGGKNIAPAYLEGLLTEDPLISQAVIIGDRRNCLTALIVPEREALRGEITRRQIPVTSAAEALRHPQVLELYRQSIAQRLAHISRDEQVRNFTLLGRGFTIENDEMTPTLKLRRGVIAEHFADEIEAMYRGTACPEPSAGESV